ncbi:L,D-transpeptidase family protein [Pontibacter korlensis]|nr:L,D-transpeptidase family protein [Pontibacter korlensis]
MPYSKKRLQQAIVQYQNIVLTDNWHTFPDTLLLRPGDTSPFVPLLQENLLLTGDLPLDSATDGAVYVHRITSAVQKFQYRHGLKPDGIIGSGTVVALNIPPQQRLQQLHINMLRFDSTLTHLRAPYAIINLPDYTMQVVDSGKTLLRMRVIVGKPSLKTYPIHSELNMVVLHPYWYVPTSIAVNEIVPILRRSPNYLYKKRMRLEQETSKGWVQVNPWRVNWRDVNRANFNYRIVQLNGTGNELGKVKFPFPNSLPQYLHDTPKKEFFKYPDRAFSHGCIRLEKPVELAEYLLKCGSGYTSGDIAKLWRQQKPNHYIRVKNPVPLHIIYLTSWVDEKMRVHFRNDVYGFDAVSGLTLQK